ncbi:hypothetical protein MJN54_34210, partial [Salmonella enterica subsp. enterica serovar Kentucky]|nr:hypothetical protein [Salmonella enterica subsp. enterica serovar Kentucky]
MLFGEHGCAKTSLQGKTIVDMSSISPIETKRFAQRVNEMGADNEDCFIHTPSDSQQIKQIINQHPDTLFIVFMAIANVHFDEYL